MQTINKIADTTALKHQFNVGALHINDRGELATCVILKEIIALNDEVIQQTLGSLNYHTFFTTWHRVELMNETALPGDTIELAAEFYFTQNISLEISVTVRKKIQGKGIVMAEGYFSFTMNNAENKSVYLW